MEGIRTWCYSLSLTFSPSLVNESTPSLFHHYHSLPSSPSPSFLSLTLSPPSPSPSLLPHPHPLSSLYPHTQDQDHYAMLGLGKLRYKASAQDIRKACKSDSLTVPVLDRKVAAKSSSCPTPQPRGEGKREGVMNYRRWDRDTSLRMRVEICSLLL